METNRYCGLWFDWWLGRALGGHVHFGKARSTHRCRNEYAENYALQNVTQKRSAYVEKASSRGIDKLSVVMRREFGISTMTSFAYHVYYRFMIELLEDFDD